MTRYYDTQIGRFISPDTPDYLAPDIVGGVDLYAYCRYNPVMRKDPTGHWDWYSVINNTAKVLAVAALIGATMAVIVYPDSFPATLALGAASGGFVGGFMNEAQGGSFIFGWIGGAVNGGIQTLCIRAGQKLGIKGGQFAGTVVGGFAGSFSGTFIMQGLDSISGFGPKRSLEEIAKNSLIGGISSAITSIVTGFMNEASDMAIKEGLVVGGDIYNGVPGTAYTKEFGEMLTAFFSAVDDAISYIISILDWWW